MPVNARLPQRGARLLALALLALLTTAAASSLGFALSACESATNLDVNYRDANTSTPLEASPGDPDAEAGPPGSAIPVFAGCPCDQSAGFGCCLTPPGETSFCTDSPSFCGDQKLGIHLNCVGPDPLTESLCCWHLGPGNTAKGAVTAYASACDGGVPACTTNAECAGTNPVCTTKVCPAKTGPGMLIGACGPTAPPCP